jgi:hypothetical protein
MANALKRPCAATGSVIAPMRRMIAGWLVLLPAHPSWLQAQNGPGTPIVRFDGYRLIVRIEEKSRDPGLHPS